MSTEPIDIRGERMFAHRAKLFKGQSMLVCLIALIPLVAAGCGGGDEAADGTAGAAERGEPQDVADADPEDVEVIEAWSAALTQGDVKEAAGYFALPSTAENGPILIEIESLEDAIAFNESLPCGSEVISARTEGDFTSATFRLLDRPGGDCGSGTGDTASTSFEIEDGEIVEWRRIDELPPGGGGGAGEGAPI